MRTFSSYLFFVLGISVLISGIIYTFLGYFTTRYSEPLTDGLGREILPAPFWLLLIGRTDWRGFGWFAADLLFLLLWFVLIAIFMGIHLKLKKDS